MRTLAAAGHAAEGEFCKYRCVFDYGVVYAALLPELAALGDVLARQTQWADDLRAVRARQLRILQVSTSVLGPS